MTSSGVEAAPRALRWSAGPASMIVAAVVGVAVLAAQGASADGLLGACVAVVLVALAAVDLAERRIPNRIVLPAALAALVAQLALHPDRGLEVVGAGLGAAAFFLVPGLVVGGSVGMGDVKLALLIGIVLGSAVIPALVVGTLAAAVGAAAVLVVRGRSCRKATIPYGPYLAAGAIAVLLLGGG